MSYILDALRRADAERERGAVPSLQSQQHTVSEDDAAPARPRALVWAVIALAIATIALLAWNFLGGAAPPPAKRVGAATTAAPAAAEPRIHSQAELPEDIRRDLPKLVIGGSSYSGDAASRMVMINGQVFHEGDRLAPDLVLERIRLKSAVLTFKGWRYEVLF